MPFQCREAKLGQGNPFGCVYRNLSCERANACSDLDTITQCARASKHCLFKGSSCKEKQNTNVRVVPLLKHSNPVMEKWFHEAFTAFGAFLHYYQELAKTNNKASIVQAMNAAWGGGLPGDAANNAWLGIQKIAEFIGGIDVIDASITDTLLRQIWESWARYPANLLSWIIYPVAGVDTTDLADLNNKFLQYRVHGNMVTWIDDGLCMFSWIMDLTVANCPPAQTPRPDPTKWLQKIQANVAITTP